MAPTLEEQYRSVKSRIEEITSAKLRAEGELTALQGQLDQLKHEAEEKFGSSDIAELTATANQIEESLSTILKNLTQQLEGVR